MACNTTYKYFSKRETLLRFTSYLRLPFARFQSQLLNDFFPPRALFPPSQWPLFLLPPLLTETNNQFRIKYCSNVQNVSKFYDYWLETHMMWDFLQPQAAWRRSLLLSIPALIQVAHLLTWNWIEIFIRVIYDIISNIYYFLLLLRHRWYFSKIFF